jgi:uncharacterized protein (DUF885 family)
MLLKQAKPHVAILVLAGLLLGGCLGTQPAPPRDPASNLESLITQYVAAHSDNEGQDPIFSADSQLTDIQSKQQMLEKLHAISVNGLSLQQNTDLKLLSGILESDINTAQAQRRWENDPAMYVPSRALGALLVADSPASVPGRADRLGHLLRQLPAQFAEARAELRNPPLRFTREAIFQVQNTLDSVISGKTLFAGLEMDALFDQSAEQLRAYLDFLNEEILPRSTGDWALGREAYDFVLQHRWFMDSSADKIRERGYQAFAETEALAQQVAERIEPGKHWTEVYERLKDDHPAAADIKQAYQQQMDAAQQFVREHGILTLPEGENVVTIDTPPAMRRSSPFGTFQTVDPFGDGLQGTLILTPIEEWMTAEQQLARLRSHHTAWIPVIAVHEAYPGHHAHALKTRDNPRILRKIAHEPIFSEGWGLFTEELMYEQGFLQGDDVRLTQLRNRLWRAARVILDSSLHSGVMSFEEAVDFLVEKVRFERYAAELEVGMYIRRPTYVLGYLVGMQELMKIRDDYIRLHGEPSPPSVFYDRLLSVGSIPPALAREEILGATPAQ